MAAMKRHVDVAVRRWRAFTGQEAVLVAGGEPFAAVSAARRGETLA